MQHAQQVTQGRVPQKKMLTGIKTHPYQNTFQGSSQNRNTGIHRIQSGAKTQLSIHLKIGMFSVAGYRFQMNSTLGVIYFLTAGLHYALSQSSLTLLSTTLLSLLLILIKLLKLLM